MQVRAAPAAQGGDAAEQVLPHHQQRTVLAADHRRCWHDHRAGRAKAAALVLAPIRALLTDAAAPRLCSSAPCVSQAKHMCSWLMHHSWAHTTNIIILTTRATGSISISDDPTLQDDNILHQAARACCRQSITSGDRHSESCSNITQQQHYQLQLRQHGPDRLSARQPPVLGATSTFLHPCSGKLHAQEHCAGCAAKQACITGPQRQAGRALCGSH